jgi:hypothetical protein
MAPDVADEISMAWAAEPIPDEHHLYMRVHRTQLDSDGEPYPHAFKNQPTSADGMSTDWDWYATPADTQNGGRHSATEYAVIALSVIATRAIPSQSVVHKPIPTNRAHTEVFGDKKSTEVRERFMQIYQMIVRLGTLA